MARERKVFPKYDECARVWASCGQHEGRSHGHRMYFIGDTIYSYGGHFPMARYVSNESGKKAVLVNVDRYSSTTGRHQNAVASALNARFSGQRFYVPTDLIIGFRDEREHHATHLKWRVEKIRELYEKAKKARGRKALLVNEAMDHVGDARTWATFFGLPTPFVVSKDDTAIKLALALDDRDLYLSALVAASREIGSVVDVLEVSARHLNKE
jgi:hypothetical protein